MNVFGPIARSAEDLELLLDVLRRREPPWTAELPPPPDDLHALRVAAWLDDPFCPIDAEVLEVTRAATAALEASGVQVDREARPQLDPSEALDLGGRLINPAISHSDPDLSAGPSHREWLDPQRRPRGGPIPVGGVFHALRRDPDARRLRAAVPARPGRRCHHADCDLQWGETPVSRCGELECADGNGLPAVHRSPDRAGRFGAYQPGCRWWAPTARIGERSGWRRGSPNAAAAIRFPRSHDESRGGPTAPSSAAGYARGRFFSTPPTPGRPPPPTPRPRRRSSPGSASPPRNVCSPNSGAAQRRSPGVSCSPTMGPS